MQTNDTQKVTLINSTKAQPGLVAFYDIRPGNGAGLFLQPIRSPQGALHAVVVRKHFSHVVGP